MNTFKVTIKGITPLMQHRMDEDTLFGLLGSKSKKKIDKVELTPREIAEKAVYKADGKFVFPSSYISGAFAHVAGDYKQSSSSRKSYKTIAAGIFRPTKEFIDLKDGNGLEIRDFEVDVRKGNNHQRGAICVCRPRFDSWSADFTVEIDNELIDQATANQILIDAGKRSGIGSFRVSKGGIFGQFQVTEWKKI